MERSRQKPVRLFIPKVILLMPPPTMRDGGWPLEQLKTFPDGTSNVPGPKEEPPYKGKGVSKVELYVKKI